MRRKRPARLIVGEPDRELVKLSRMRSSRTVFGLSPSVKKAMDMRIVEDGYGLRGKSRWIKDAVEEFLDPKTWGEMAPDAWKRIALDIELLRGETIKEGVDLDPKFRLKAWRSALEAMIYGLDQEDPIYVELSVPSILRAAITWKTSTSSNV